jgi:hypothetical protein
VLQEEQFHQQQEPQVLLHQQAVEEQFHQQQEPQVLPLQ